MSDLPRPAIAILPPSKQWQFPLLLASLALFSLGILRLVPRRATLTLDQRIHAIRGQISAGEYIAAHTALTRELEASDLAGASAVELHRLAAEAIYAAERSAAVHGRENAERLVGHFRAITKLNSTLNATELLRLGDAHSWCGQGDDAIEPYESALAAGAPNAGSVRQMLINLLRAAQPLDEDKLAATLDAQLQDESTEPEPLYEAFALQIDRLLSARRVDAAQALIDRIAPRFKNTPHASEAAFARARTLVASGDAPEAARLLREMRNAWSPPDDLWVQSGLLLAKIEQNDGRPESALSFLEESESALKSAAQRVECLLGRAQCLASLDRYAEAATVYRTLVAIAADSVTAASVDRDLLRAGLTSAAAYLNGNGRPEEGLAFLHMASGLVGVEDTDQQAAYAQEEAALNSSLAARAASDLDAAMDEPARAKLVHRRARFNLAAGNALLQLADLRSSDEPASIDAVWRAVDAFDGAGDSSRSAALLEEFIDEHPDHPRRVAAMLRLAKLRHSTRAYKSAVAMYDLIQSQYPRTQDALQSLVPMVMCLLAIGGDSTAQAEKLLIRILDEAPDNKPLFDPRAPEYGDALFKLAELHYQQKRNEDAIARFESFLSLYPEDARNAAVRFMMADAYRRSGRALLDEREKTADGDARARVESEARLRLLRAAETFARVMQDDLADEDRLAAHERVRLRAAWLYRGDCLFDLGEYSAARDVYADAVWRFDNELTAVTASMQLVHCHRRLGQSDEGLTALERLKWLLRKMPDVAFTRQPAAKDRVYWLAMVDRMIEGRIH